MREGDRFMRSRPDIVVYLAFVDYRPGTELKKNIEHLTRAMKNATRYGNKDTFLFVSLSDSDDGCIIERVARARDMAFKERMTGVVIMTGNKAGVGVSLPLVDCVLHLHDQTSTDNYVQRSFRCDGWAAGKGAAAAATLQLRALEAVRLASGASAAALLLLPALEAGLLASGASACAACPKNRFMVSHPNTLFAGCAQDDAGAAEAEGGCVSKPKSLLAGFCSRHRHGFGKCI